MGDDAKGGDKALWRRYDDAVYAIHATKDMDAMRRTLMGILPDLIPHGCSFFDLCTSRGPKVQFHSPVTYNMSDESLLEYYDRYAASDYVAWMFNTGEALVYRDTDMVPQRVRERSDIYRNWMSPLGAHYGLGCTIVANDTMYGSITLFRGREDGDFDDDELELLGRLNRHLIGRYSSAADGGDPLAHLSDMGEVRAHYLLTRREGEVLELMRAGLGNAEVSERLCIAVSTTKKHVNSIYRKLGVRGRPQLMRLLYQLTSTSVDGGR